MKERQKILELLQEGRLTVDQAEQLLAAMDRVKTDSANADAANTAKSEKNPLEDLKNIGAQVSSSIAQSLTDLRRNLEHQWDNWTPFGGNSALASTEISLPASVETLSIETTNGDIQVVAWDEPYARLYIRGRVRADSVLEAKRLLGEALQSTQTDSHYELVVLHGGKDGVNQASVDLYVPRALKQVTLHSQNGHLQLDSVNADDLQAETVNGAISLSRAKAVRIRLVTHNGHVDVHSSVSADTRTVYVSTRNGTIDVKGIDAELQFSGSAKTSLGRVEVSGEGWTVEYDDSIRKRSAHFEPTNQDSMVAEENTAEEQAKKIADTNARIFLETKHGSINVRK